jgi:hypothetical protein
MATKGKLRAFEVSWEFSDVTETIAAHSAGEARYLAALRIQYAVDTPIGELFKELRVLRAPHSDHLAKALWKKRWEP